MKAQLVLFALFFLSCTIKAQQRNPSQGYLEINVKYIGKSELDVPPPPPPPPPSPSFQGEAPQTEVYISPTAYEGNKINIWFDSVYEKVENYVYGRSTILFNSVNQTTITLQETSGIKEGYIASKEDEAFINKYMNSLMNRKPATEPLTRVEYINESRQINGFNCKKAFLVTENENAIKDTAIIWYCPDYKLPGHFSFSTDKPEHKQRLKCLQKINGLPIEAEINYSPKMKIKLEVKKADFRKAIAPKEFRVPPGFVLKSIREKYGFDTH